MSYSASKNCICGCYGRSYKNCSWEVDLKKYSKCPARKRRKASLKKRKENYRIKKRIKEKLTRETEKHLQAQLQAQKLEQEEAIRVSNNEPALSKEEAIRRHLNTYMGKPCKHGHNGERLARNSNCIVCKKIANDIRNARKRGAGENTLTIGEKEKIIVIYNEARRLSKIMGKQFHVDHIKPLAAGGKHHPDNLQILEAHQNLSKGAKWGYGEEKVIGILYEDILPEHRNKSSLHVPNKFFLREKDGPKVNKPKGFLAWLLGS